MSLVLDVARHLGVGWDLIRDIEHRHLKKKFSRPRLKEVQRIAIDEIAVRKGHKYLTLVLDLDRGNVLFVGNGRKSEALTPFWTRLKKAGAQIKAVAIDMSPAYIKAVTENLPNAMLVLDRFHLVKLFNDKLSELRRQLYREASGLLEKNVLKGTRWLLLKNQDNLNDNHGESTRLQEALSLNKPLATAYYLKESLKEFWNQQSKQRTC
ncbi:MAG: ISL3 family transposase [Planctomycetaceae bacterium]|nr:ISL3 family transposase [Planctomycetaceae bacterium]